jgi:4-amino-4-deoxy-L-arabinose transferase-like glycosyltransferase
MGQQVGQGAVLYRDVTDNKPPMIFLVGALVAQLPGVNQINLLIFDTLIAGLSILLFCLIIRKYTSAVFWPTTAFIIFTNAHRISQGGFLTEHYLLFFILLAWFFWLKDSPSLWTDFWSGVCLALAFLSKQVAVATLAGLGIYILICRNFSLLRRYLWLLSGFIITVGLCLFYLSVQGALANFWQDCVVYLAQYRQQQGQNPWGDFLAVILDNLASAALLWFLFAAAWRQNKLQNPLRLLFIICAVLEFLAFTAGKTFYGHQILPLAPTVGFLIVLSLPEKFYTQNISKRTKLIQHRTVLVIFLAAALVFQVYYTIRAFKQFPALLDDYRTAKYIEYNTNPADYLYAAHENTRIAFLAKRRHFYKRPYMAYPFSAEEREFIQRRFDSVKPLYIINDLPVYAQTQDYFLEKEIGRYKLWRRK